MSEEEKPLHVVELRAENVQRLRAVRIRPDGEMVVIGGQNAVGKSSVLDSIEMALGGERTIGPEPIRQGERRARIVVDLDELVIERTFSAKGTKLEVRRKGERKPLAKPQHVLKELASKFMWDPLAFCTMPPMEQDALLKQVIGIDFTDHDTARKGFYDQRTEANREAKKLEARLEQMPLHRDVPDAEVSVANLVEQISAGERKLRENEDGRRRVWDLAAKRVDLDEAIQDLEQQLAEARQTRAKVDASLAEAQKQVSVYSDPDLAALREQAAAAEETNAKVRANAERKRVEDELEAEVRRSNEADDAIESIDEEKAAILSSAEFPVEGLGFSDVGPTLDGVAFEQASQAQKLRVSVALGMALRPRLRVLLVREGSRLDQKGIRLLAELAKEQNAQVWLERVSEDGDGCDIVIEDGEVREETAAAE